jgi:hypothetical protein
VEEPGQVDHVVGGVSGRQAVQRGVDAEADDLHGPGVVHEHVLGRQQPVGDTVGVGDGDRVRDLADQPGAATG